MKNSIITISSLFNEKILLLVLIFGTFYSCSKDVDNDSTEFILNEERINLTIELSNIFEEEFDKLINENSPFEEGNSIEEFTIKANHNFKQRLESDKALQSCLKSSQVTTIDTTDINYSLLDDKIANIIEGINPDEDWDKEESYNQLSLHFDNYINKVGASDTLTNTEKQLIIEYLYAKLNFIFTISDYFETTDDVNLKSANACGWFCRNKQVLICMADTAVAAVACGLTVTSIIGEQYVDAALMGIWCYTSIDKAIRCCKDLNS